MKKDTDLRPDPVLFRSRLVGKDVYCGGATFHLQALTFRVVTHIDAIVRGADGKRDATAYVLNVLAYGISSISGLNDEDGNAVEPQRDKVSIIGKEYTPLSLEWLEQLDASVLHALFDEVIALTNLTADERLRLDFTKPSQPT